MISQTFIVVEAKISMKSLYINPIYPAGPLVKIAPEQKIGAGRRPRLLGELI